MSPFLLRVPYTFFVTLELAFLLCLKRQRGFSFSLIRESIFFHPLETGFRLSIVFVIREIYIYLRVICEPTIFAGIIFHSFGDFSVIKARKTTPN